MDFEAQLFFSQMLFTYSPAANSRAKKAMRVRNGGARSALTRVAATNEQKAASATPRAKTSA